MNWLSIIIPSMKKLFPFIFSFFFCLALNAQVGVSLSYRNIDAPYWGFLLGENETIFKNGHSFSVDYWLKMNNLRIDLLPEIGFSKFSNEIAPIGIYPKRTFIAQFLKKKESKKFKRIAHDFFTSTNLVCSFHSITIEWLHLKQIFRILIYW